MSEYPVGLSGSLYYITPHSCVTVDTVRSPHAAVWSLISQASLYWSWKNWKPSSLEAVVSWDRQVNRLWSGSFEQSSSPTLILPPFLDQAHIHPHVSLHPHTFLQGLRRLFLLYPSSYGFPCLQPLLLNPRHPQNVPSDSNKEGFRINFPPHTSCTESA